MGVNLYNEQTDRFKRYLVKSPSARGGGQIGVWAFLEDSNKQLWFGTSNGLYKLIVLNLVLRDLLGKFFFTDRDPQNIGTWS